MEISKILHTKHHFMKINIISIFLDRDLCENYGHHTSSRCGPLIYVLSTHVAAFNSLSMRPINYSHFTPLRYTLATQLLSATHHSAPVCSTPLRSALLKQPSSCMSTQTYKMNCIGSWYILNYTPLLLTSNVR